jgi:glycolate oxidase iron-sulfur subunit
MMYDMHKLARLLRELEDQLVACMRCGMCQAVCPVFAETGRESDVARGKLALLDGLLQQMFEDPHGVHERLSKCLLCGSCAANCPSGVRVLDIFLKARAILAGYIGLPSAKRALFRGLLAQPALFDRLLRWAAKLQGVFLKPADELLGSSCARFESPLADRHVKALAPVSLRRRTGSLNRPAGRAGIKVGFFVGCLVDKVFPQVGTAVLRSMEHHGVGVYLPEEQGCCGIPALSSGDLNAFTQLVRFNVQRFGAETCDVLVTACATCTATIKKVWPLMTQDLSSEEQRQVGELVEKTMDISAFLVDRIGVNPSIDTVSPEVAITYHDPCHLKKSLGVAAQPRTLLRAHPGRRLVEMAEADRCCGCGGSFNLQHYEISASIGRRKRDNIVSSGCREVATGCPACMLQITDMLSQGRDPIQVKHAIEVYAESLPESE